MVYWQTKTWPLLFIVQISVLIPCLLNTPDKTICQLQEYSVC